MTEFCTIIDNYVKLSYAVKRLNAKLNRLPDFIFSSAVECDYRELGLSEEYVAILEGDSSSVKIKECYDALDKKVNDMREYIYSTIYKLPQADKENVYDYLTSQSYAFTVESEIVQSAYLRTVQEIENAEKSQDSSAIRVLGKLAKAQYSKYYELDSMKNTYTYLGCYMSSMVGKKFGKK